MNVSQTTKLISELSRTELACWCESQGEAKFRADQIWHWIFRKRVADFDAMHDLPIRFRAVLKENFDLLRAKLVKHQIARDRTEKLLLELTDGSHVECVLMRELKRRTVCVSTQVGCAMGCIFCASGLMGLKRNLSTGEILEQILWLDRLLGDDERITNVVVMGIGEPLANLKALLPALETLQAEAGPGLSARRVTISTVGLPDKIRELALLGKPYNLAVSLHAPNDRLRNELVPVNVRIGIQAILEAADEYFQRTGRRVTYEYVLLANVNDEPQHARQLASLLKRRNAHVNLIPMNGVEELSLKGSAAARTHGFVELLESAGISTTVRKQKGADIDAACGQLRLQQQKSQTVPLR